MQHSYVPAVKSVASSNLSLSPPANLPTTTLPDLPTEIIIEIYKVADTFATAERLSKTSHRLHNIWKVHDDAILSSVVECFPQAQKLAHLQEDNLSQRRPSSERQQTTTTAHRICLNANLISKILYAFKNRIIDEFARRGVRRKELTRTERADFIRACYRAMTLAAEDRWGIPRSVHESLDMLDYMQMKEAMTFLNLWFNCINASPDTRRRNNIHDIEKFFDLARAISEASQRLWFFHVDLFDLMESRFDCVDFLLWGSRDLEHYHIVAEGYQKKAGSARGMRLAELLPLLFAQNGRYTEKWQTHAFSE